MIVNIIYIASHFKPFYIQYIIKKWSSAVRYKLLWKYFWNAIKFCGLAYWYRSALTSINEVIRRRARLVLGWVTGPGLTPVQEIKGR